MGERSSFDFSPILFVPQKKSLDALALLVVVLVTGGCHYFVDLSGRICFVSISFSKCPSFQCSFFLRKKNKKKIKKKKKKSLNCKEVRHGKHLKGMKDGERSKGDVSGREGKAFWDTTAKKAGREHGMGERSRRNGMSRTSTSTSNGSDPADFFWEQNEITLK